MRSRRRAGLLLAVAPAVRTWLPRVIVSVVASLGLLACGEPEVGLAGGPFDAPPPVDAPAVIPGAAGDATTPPPIDAPVDAAVDAPEVPVDAPPAADAPGAPPMDAPPSPDGCAVAPTADWSGSTGTVEAGTSSYTTVDASVRWTLVSSANCVERYQPVGTVSYHHDGHCGGGDTPHAIGPDDGALTIDRSSWPARYVMRGVTTWPVTVWCDDNEPHVQTVGGTWADVAGVFDRRVIAGRLDDEDHRGYEQHWRLTPVDATFEVAGDGCSEPPSDRWRSVIEHHVVATAVTWTRVSTTGCRDVFEPAGAMAIGPAAGGDCTESTLDPAAITVVPGHGRLVVDRSTAPATFDVDGVILYAGTWRCRHADGSVAATPVQVPLRWADFGGALEGNELGADLTSSGTWPAYHDAWRFSRL